VPDESDHALAVLRRLVTTDAVLIGLATSAPPPPAQLGLVRLGIDGLAPVRLHAVYRADDRRAVLLPLLTALGRPAAAADRPGERPGAEVPTPA
jgi:hypothetical protein